MLSLIGIHQSSFVAKLSTELCKNGCNLSDSTMGRLENYFTIILMVEYEGNKNSLNNIITSVCLTLNLDSHLVQIQDSSSHHFELDVRISLFAESSIGAVEDVTVSLLMRY